MRLRPRQEVFVERCVSALDEHRNTLGVAPTGAGKTVCLSAIAGRVGGRALVLQHRGELVEQNRRTFELVNPGRETSVWTAGEKQQSATTFAMVQTLYRPRSLNQLDPVDLVVVDEAHHAPAPTWQTILDRARTLNPTCQILGVTATPNRGDGKGLGGVFSNVGDVITLGETIRAGHLVEPRAFVMSVGIDQQLGEIRRTSSGEYDMHAAADVMTPVTDAVIAHWREHAADRITVAFCCTVEHAEHLADTFRRRGVAAEAVTGTTPPDERARVLAALETGEVQVLCNVAVATEGWDCPPVSCVLLLRPSSYKSTMVQMIGRGLRVVDPERNPGIEKTDCIVLDFGRSIQLHGGLEQLVDLDGRHKDEELASAPTKVCPKCDAVVPLAVRVCPLCDHVWPPVERGEIGADGFRMVAYDLGRSPFRWYQRSPRLRLATAFSASAVVFEQSGHWHAVGIRAGGVVRHLVTGTAPMADAAADDWMLLHGDQASASKTKTWLEKPPTPKQTELLIRFGVIGPGRDGEWDFSLSRYEASCLIDLYLNRRKILAAMRETSTRRAA